MIKNFKPDKNRGNKKTVDHGTLTMVGSRHAVTLLALICSLSVSAQVKHHFTHQDSLRGSMNPARMYDVKFYDLDILVIPEEKSIYGSNTIYFKAIENLDSIQIDLNSNMKINRIATSSPENNTLNYRREGDFIFIYPPSKIKLDSNFKFTIRYSGKPREAVKAPWDGGFVWKKDREGNDWIGTACEGIGASTWWPCKDYLGDEPDSMRITCFSPKGYYCKSNGMLISDEAKVIEYQTDPVNNPDQTKEVEYEKFEWKVDYPINTYDVTLNIGKYAEIKDSFYSDAGKLALRFYPLEENRAQAHAYFPFRTKQMLKCFEHYFGPYPFFKDGYSLVETSYWGMEHQGAVAYGNHFKDSTLGYNFDFILIHESAHEWWGNSLSCSDEAEMWLHESFATYAEALYVEYYWGKDAGIDYLMKQKGRIANEENIIGPMGVNYHERPDNDIYYKGSWMLHTLRNVINNDSLWFRIIYTFATKYKCSIVHTEDFTNLVNKMTGKDYSAFYEQYLRRTKLPVLRYRLISHGPGSTLKLKYRWETDVKNFDMPLDVNISGHMVRIHPTRKWTKVKYPPIDRTFNLGEKKFLYELKYVGEK